MNQRPEGRRGSSDIVRLDRRERGASQAVAHDAELRRALCESDEFARPSPRELRALRDRIAFAARPELDARSLGGSTIWDYAARWSTVLLPVGLVTTLAASCCLFAFAGPRDVTTPVSPARVALLGAATNRVSSQNLIDLLVSAEVTDPAGPFRGESER